MKPNKITIVFFFYFFLLGCMSAQTHYILIHTKQEAMNGIQLGCSCQKNVKWIAASSTMTGFTEAQKTQSQPVVKPTQTESYYLKSNESNATITFARYTVVVVDSRIWEKNNISECMSKRRLSFMGEMANVGDLNLLYNPNNALANGTTIVKSWSLNYKGVNFSKVGSIDVMSMLNKVSKDWISEVLNTTNSVDTYEFTFSTTLKGRNCEKEYERAIYSDKYVINIFKLFITKFRDKASQKDWKVVVGQDIEKEAKASSDCTNFGWEMPDTRPTLLSSEKVWNLQGSGSNNVNVKIPFSDLTTTFNNVRVSNSDFGDKYGCVKVFCKDNFGNGQWHTTVSRNTPTGADLVMNPPKSVKVYFPRDVDLAGNPVYVLGASPGSGNGTSNSNPPLWFIFWKEGNVVDLLNNVNYLNDNTVYGQTIGSQVSITANAVDRADDNSHFVLALTPAGLPSTNSIHYGSTGNHACSLIGTLTHENYHRAINVSPSGGPFNPRPGYESDGDGILDSEELMPPNSPPLGNPSFPISFVGNPDSYDLEHKVDNVYKGYGDNELRCRILQKNITTNGWNAYYHIDKDWSAIIYNLNW